MSSHVTCGDSSGYAYPFFTDVTGLLHHFECAPWAATEHDTSSFSSSLVTLTGRFFVFFEYKQGATGVPLCELFYSSVLRHYSFDLFSTTVESLSSTDISFVSTESSFVLLVARWSSIRGASPPHVTFTHEAESSLGSILLPFTTFVTYSHIVSNTFFRIGAAFESLSTVPTRASTAWGDSS